MIFACPCTPRAWLRTHLDRALATGHCCNATYISTAFEINTARRLIVLSLLQAASKDARSDAHSRMPLLSHMAAAAARGPDAGQGRTGGRWLLARCRVPARQGKARLPRRACMHRATQAHPSRFGHARTGHALNYWRHARRERSRAPAGSMIGARVRGAPRRVPSGSGCHVGVRVQLSQAEAAATAIAVSALLPVEWRLRALFLAATGFRGASIGLHPSRSRTRTTTPPAGRLPFRWIHRGQGNNRARVTCGASPCPGVRLRFGLVWIQSTH